MHSHASSTLVHYFYEAVQCFILWCSTEYEFVCTLYTCSCNVVPTCSDACCWMATFACACTILTCLIRLYNYMKYVFKNLFKRTFPDLAGFCRFRTMLDTVCPSGRFQGETLRIRHIPNFVKVFWWV